jgi:sirohydrochlorin ferrochelatase
MNGETIGIIIVDHGSLRAESNEMLLDVVALFSRHTGYEIVEPAHMELAEPSIQTAFDRCVARGAKLVVVHPYLLLPGRHWHEDIPALTAAAAKKHRGVRFLVTAPLGRHPLIAEVIRDRIQHCLAHARGEAEPCDACADTPGCRIEGAVVGRPFQADSNAST